MDEDVEMPEPPPATPKPVSKMLRKARAKDKAKTKAKGKAETALARAKAQRTPEGAAEVLKTMVATHVDILTKDLALPVPPLTGGLEKQNASLRKRHAQLLRRFEELGAYIESLETMQKSRILSLLTFQEEENKRLRRDELVITPATSLCANQPFDTFSAK